MRNLLFILAICSTTISLATGDDDKKSTEASEKVYDTFITQRAINAVTPVTMEKRRLLFQITHRFGNIGPQSGGGVHSFFGLDEARDIRFALDYGITDNLQIGLARNKYKEFVDGTIKYRIMTQTKDNKKPVSIALYSNTAVTPETDIDTIYTKFIHRFSFTNQLIIARKFGERLSLQVSPTVTHRNIVRVDDDLREDENTLFSVGVAGRFRVSKVVAILADYYYIMSDYRTGHPTVDYFAPIGLGLEMKTGGHVFHVNWTNAPAIIENGYVPYTTEDWLKGGWKFGFTISRVFKI